jgi:hypothetical protein
MTNTANFWLPTRPYSLIEAINRMSAATGSPRYAELAANSDYNGHSVTVGFNDYRKYWVAEYTWAGRVVLCRGSFEDCVRAAKAEHDRGAKGSVVRVRNVPADQIALVESLGFVAWSENAEKAHVATFRDARYDEINGAMAYERQLGCPAVGFLANSATLEEYNAKCDAFFAERRAARGTR